MRSDYGLYGVAVICFLLAAVFAAGMVPGYGLSEASGITVTVVFLLIGIIAATVGYSARPKAMMPPRPVPAPIPATPVAEPTPTAEETQEPAAPPSLPPTSIEEVSVSSEPAPPQPSEPSPPVVATSEVTVQPTPMEASVEEKPKTTRRRRKKAVA